MNRNINPNPEPNSWVIAETMGNEKKEFRQKVNALKKLVSTDEMIRQSKQIFDEVEKLMDFQQAKVVLAYWSMDDEVFTHDFIEKWWKDKIILLPSVHGDNLIIRQYQGMQNMRPGDLFGISEPATDVFDDFDSINLIIVPGMAFDKNKNRMGRGRGYYDRFLKSVKAFRIGICFDFQYFDKIPVDDFDLPMSEVIYYKKR